MRIVVRPTIDGVAATIDVEMTTRYADEALIRAKRNGRNRIEISTNFASFAA